MTPEPPAPDHGPERCHRCYRPLVDGACASCGRREDPFEAAAATPTPEPGPAFGQGPSEASDPFAPSAELPPEPSGGFSPPSDANAKPGADLPRTAIWVAIATLIAVYVFLGGGLEQGVASSALLDAGALTPTLFETFRHDWWRLVLATYLHSGWFLLLISSLMVWILGGPAERRAGGGLVLFLIVVGGTLLNVLRVGLEPSGSLSGLAGAWPAGLALGGAALTLGARTAGPRPRVIASLLFEAGLLAIIAYQGDLFSWGLVLVMGCAVGLGTFTGAIWPLDTSRAPTGCFFTLFCLCMLTFALWGRRADVKRMPAPPLAWRTSNPAEWEAWKEQHGGRTREPATFEAREVPELEVGLDVPASWSRQVVAATAECPSCEETVELPEEPPETAEGEKPTVPCPRCEAEVPYKKPPVRRVVFQESALFGMRRQIMVSAWPRGPFDAPDTLAQRLIADFAQPGAWFQNADVTQDAPFESDTLGHGHQIVLRGKIQGNAVLMRLYVFVDSKRTIFLRALDQDSGNPLDWEASSELFNRVARSVHLIKPPKRK